LERSKKKHGNWSIYKEVVPAEMAISRKNVAENNEK
jgi:hypothetical protein